MEGIEIADKTTLFIIRSVLFTFITVPLFLAYADDDDSEKKRYHKISDWDDDSSDDDSDGNISHIRWIRLREFIILLVSKIAETVDSTPLISKNLRKE